MILITFVDDDAVLKVYLDNVTFFDLVDSLFQLDYGEAVVDRVSEEDT